LPDKTPAAIIFYCKIFTSPSGNPAAKKYFFKNPLYRKVVQVIENIFRPNRPECFAACGMLSAEGHTWKLIHQNFTVKQMPPSLPEPL
jgi:hypothetical protein